jgi:hypothetical protein
MNASISIRCSSSISINCSSMSSAAALCIALYCSSS